ncbi:MAG: MgtC/SapB family protein [Candidatus Acidiferrales bacterium]
MPTTLTWQDIGLRILLTAVSAGIIGYDRDERGRSAGLRTNILVGLAACFAMIQANVLINSNGKPSDSFVVMDTMRLPLGILSGIGFIGAGAIVKRGELVVGLTTAATLWFVTVMGLCYGGGQINLGLAAFIIGFAVLLAVKEMENRMRREHSAMLRVSVTANGPRHEEIETLLKRAGISLSNPSLLYASTPTENTVFGWKLRWRGEREETNAPAAIQELATHPDIRGLEFTPPE